MHGTGGVIELRAEETHALRRAVLRTGTPSDVVEFDGDEEPTTFHLGVEIVGELVAIASWMRRPFDGDVEAYQLRGMATAPGRRGSGLGSRLLVAGLERCRERRVTTVWARARVTAVEFYVRHGFEVVGDEFVDATTGLPHVQIRRTLDPPM